MKQRRLVRRLAVVCCAVIGSTALPAFTGSAGAMAIAGPPVNASTDGSWACVVVEHVNLGVCQGNPLPPSLPVDVPSVPV